MRVPRTPVLALLICLGCSSSKNTGASETDGGAHDGAVKDSGKSATGDAASTRDSGTGGRTDGGGGGDSSIGVADSGPPPWNGMFSGPITCTTPGNYANNAAPACGVQRWDIKTGTDSMAAGMSLLPMLSTVTSLGALPTPSPFPSGPRVGPIETSVYALKDVQLIFARLEDDSDYHLVMSDGTNTMITEIPYPGNNCTSGSAWSCFISRARATVETNIGVGNLMLDMGHNHNLTVSIIGVGFFDPEHGQFDVAPNNLELHPVLAICFGQGCDPTM